MSKVYIQTIAYNAEKTIHRCVESILNQTYKGEIRWDILDNGSTDHTFSILSDYMQQDERLNLLHIDHNCDPQNETELAVWNRFYRRSGLTSFNGEYYCTLDSDDAYHVDFLEKTLAFIKENNLDMAAVGNDFVDGATNKTVHVRKLNHNIILSDANTFDGYFQHYHQFFRTVWGKVYKMSLLKDYVRNDELSYGSDTWFAFYTARQAQRIGVLADSLHKYYRSPKSVSHQWDQKRILSDRILHEATRDFLIEKCGTVSRQNEDYQLAIYTNAIRDTLNVLINASTPLREKIEGVIDIANNAYTRQLIAREEFCFNPDAVQEMFKMRKDVVSAAANWLLSLNEVPDDLIEGYCNTGELLCASVENADGWLHFKKLRVHFFLEQNRKEEAKKSLQELSELIPNDLDVMDFQKCF